MNLRSAAVHHFVLKRLHFTYFAEIRKRQRNEESDNRRRTWQGRYTERTDRPSDRAAGGSTLPDTDETSRKRVIG